MDDPIPTFALRYRVLRLAAASGGVCVCPSRDEADAAVELWVYDPCILAAAGRADRLSLYLSLHDEQDERVQAALAELLKGVEW